METKKAEIIEYLTPEEEKEFEELEAIGSQLSEKSLENAREFGRILTIIKEKGWFKKQRRNSEIRPYKNFDDYVKERFNRGRSMGYNYIHVFNTMKLFDEVGVDATSLGSIQNALNVCNEIKKVVKFTNADEKEVDALVREVIKQGVNVARNICPIDEKDNPLMNIETVQIAFETVREIATSGLVEIDGKQIPIKLSDIAVNEQASLALYEQVQRRRQESLDKFIQQKESRFDQKMGVAITMSQSSKTNPVVVIAYCPKHGSQNGDSLLKAGFKMSCGCNAILEFVDGFSKFVWYKGDDS
jgi:hypothetical protein